MIILRIHVMKGNQNEFVNLKFKILKPDSKKKINPGPLTACMLSMQKGMQAQGQKPNRQQAPHTIQARALVSSFVLVVTVDWQCGQVSFIGLVFKN